MNNPQNSPSYRSLLGLTALIFFLSDIKDGIGPFLCVYLKSTLQWDTQQIGLMLAVLNITATLLLLPSGFLIDASKFKRLILSTASFLVFISCLMILAFPTYLSILTSQVFLGIAFAIIPPIMAAITIGLVGRNEFPKRVSVNEAWNHTGNLLTALIVGLLSHWYGAYWILYIAGSFALLSILSTLLINSQEIHHDVARQLNPDEDAQPTPILSLLRRPSVLIFCGSLILFQLANSAQLPLLGQLLAQKNPESDTLYMAGSIMLAQFVMIVVAYILTHSINNYGRKTLFLIAFLIVPLRATLYTLTSNPLFLMGIQVFDGIATGIFGVVSIVMVSDLAKGTGRFNFFQGLVALTVGFGATLSNLLAGTIVNSWGYSAGFLSLAVIGLGALLFFGLFMPETKIEVSTKRHPLPNTQTA